MKRDSPSYETLIFPYGVRFHKKYTVTSLPGKSCPRQEELSGDDGSALEMFYSGMGTLHHLTRLYSPAFFSSSESTLSIPFSWVSSAP
ncbi:MAG: hypothetical protein Q4A13_08820, partial [Fretibacterium sp.]|nr:hypothetical protein [Fretibacterium sp.]